MNRRFSRSPFYYAPRSFLGAVKAMTLVKQGRLMNWKRYREALLLTGDRPGIRVVRLIHRDSVRMNRLPTRLRRPSQRCCCPERFGAGRKRNSRVNLPRRDRRRRGIRRSWIKPGSRCAARATGDCIMTQPGLAWHLAEV
jgi:hypothetical protein